MSEQGTAAASAKTSGSSAAKWTIRIVIGGVLVALLVVALLQFNVKRNFEASQNALNDKEDESKSPLTLSDAESTLQGSYESAPMKTKGGQQAKVYTWSGPITSYKLKITYTASGSVSSWTAKQEDIESE